MGAMPPSDSPLAQIDLDHLVEVRHKQESMQNTVMSAPAAGLADVPMIRRKSWTDTGIIRMNFSQLGCPRRDVGGSEAWAQPSAR